MKTKEEPRRESRPDNIEDKLDTIIKLLGLIIPETTTAKSQAERIRELYRSGFSNKQISLITGASDTTVGARISETKKPIKKKVK